MSARGRPWNCAAAFLFVLLLVLALQSAWADSRAATDSGTEAADGILVTLSGDCLLSSFRFPGFSPIATVDAGDCAAEGVALVPGRGALAVVSRDDTRRTVLQTLLLPGLEKISMQEIDTGTSVALLAPAAGSFLLAVDTGKNVLHVFDRDTLAQRRQVRLHDRRGLDLTFLRMTESVSRRSVIIAFAEPELWELFLGADAEPVFEGLVHDYRMGEGIREPRQLPIRRIALDGPIDSFLVETDSPHLILTRRIEGGMTRLQRLNLDVRRVIATGRLNPAVEELVGAMPAPEQPGMPLAVDRDGLHVVAIQARPGLPRIATTGANCRITATRNGKRIYLHACRGEDRARMFAIDPMTFSVSALLQPSADGATTRAIEGRDAHHLVAVVPGDAGSVVRYRTADWCRVDRLAVPRLKDAWIYP